MPQGKPYPNTETRSYSLCYRKFFSITEKIIHDPQKNYFYLIEKKTSFLFLSRFFFCFLYNIKYKNENRIDTMSKKQNKVNKNFPPHSGVVTKQKYTAPKIKCLDIKDTKSGGAYRKETESLYLHPS
jgi:hypothetical protein